LVNGDAGSGESGLGDCVCTVCEVEDDEISDVCLDFLGLEDQAGILIGAITTDYDSYQLG